MRNERYICALTYDTHIVFYFYSFIYLYKIEKRKAFGIGLQNNLKKEKNRLRFFFSFKRLVSIYQLSKKIVHRHHIPYYEADHLESLLVCEM